MSQPHVSIDGRLYTKETDDQIDALAHATFSSEAGSLFLQYLKSITLNTVLTPKATADELRHMEGARWLVSIMQGRMTRAEGRGRMTPGIGEAVKGMNADG